MRKPPDFWTAIVLLLFCGYAGYLTADLPTGSTGTKWGPDFFPWLMVLGIGALAVVLLVRALKQNPSPAEETAKQGKGKIVAAKMILFFVVMLLYAKYYITAGYLIGTGVFFIIAMLILGERRPLHVVVIPAGIIVGIYLIFTQIMQVYLP